MKQNGFWKGFGSGLVLTVLIAALCVTATATSKRSIQVEDGIGITLNGARRGFIAPCGKFFYFFRAAGPSLQNRLSIPGKMRYNRGRYSKLF